MDHDGLGDDLPWSCEDLGELLDDGGIVTPPPPSDPRGGGSGSSPVTASAIVPWLALVAVGVALERLSMLPFVTESGPAALVLAALGFVSVPLVAGLVVVRAFARARAADGRARAAWRRLDPLRGTQPDGGATWP